ncbi:hypothetical protein RFI_15411 [Reticulomyxa filosa]|uniref:Uncharacterized protein n=1 Tax=Reticulomyxa filosa TaxID=46433 RepID=X6N912_RETFI|nr:hypothetical protein RFI_15411 [Reticulomyxa filosa]|eukprot:ETO21792.1 hypothetical protein RFI_15411 [Reticulomyxa filosa]
MSGSSKDTSNPQKTAIARKFKRQKKEAKNGASASHIRTDSGTPSHHTMSSLALLAANNPQAMGELTRVSVDMRAQKELDRLQKLVQQKESQFQSALEITDQLNIANSKVEIIKKKKGEETSTKKKKVENPLCNESHELRSKLTTIEDRYEKDFQQLQSSLEEHTQMVIQLQQDLMIKEKASQVTEQQHLSQLKEKALVYVYVLYVYFFFYKKNKIDMLANINPVDYTICAPGDARDTHEAREASDVPGAPDTPNNALHAMKIEQELKMQLEEEMKRTDDLLKEQNQFYENEISEYVEATKTISNEVVLLAAQNYKVNYNNSFMKSSFYHKSMSNICQFEHSSYISYIIYMFIYNTYTMNVATLFVNLNFK